MIRHIPVNQFLEVDTDAKTVTLVTAVPAPDDEGRVVLNREVLPDGDAGLKRLQYIFDEVQTSPPSGVAHPDAEAATLEHGDPAVRRAAERL